MKTVCKILITLLCTQHLFASSSSSMFISPPTQSLFVASDTMSEVTSNATKGPKTIAEKEKEIFQWFRTVSEVVHLIAEKHYRDVSFSDFMQEALKAAVPQTDAHSSFFSKKTYQSAMESTSGEFSGIGVSIKYKAPEDEALVIIDIIQGGPSQKILRPGDKIVSVDGATVKGLTGDEVVTKLRGKIGTKVKIKITRDKKPLEFTITRNVIKDQSSICYHFKGSDIYYLSLKIFSETAANQMAKLLKKANQQKAKGIVLDLRRNPGGVLESAIDMAGLFLPKGTPVVSTKDKKKKTVRIYKTTKKPVLKNNIPIFILIDNFTASASEILAGALQHYSNEEKNDLMVFLVGTKTFGKGSVQEVIPISNGCALKITTMMYYLPNDISIQAKGIEPDFLVKPKSTPDDEIKWIKELYGTETSLKHYISIEEITEKIKAKGSEKTESDKPEAENTALEWEEKHKNAISHDSQIQASVNMCSMLHVEKQCHPENVKTRKKALSFLRKNYLTDGDTELEQVK